MRSPMHSSLRRAVKRLGAEAATAIVRRQIESRLVPIERAQPHVDAFARQVRADKSANVAACDMYDAHVVPDRQRLKSDLGRAEAGVLTLLISKAGRPYRDPVLAAGGEPTSDSIAKAAAEVEKAAARKKTEQSIAAIIECLGRVEATGVVNDMIDADLGRCGKAFDCVCGTDVPSADGSPGIVHALVVAFNAGVALASKELLDYAKQAQTNLPRFLATEKGKPYLEGLKKQMNGMSPF